MKQADQHLKKLQEATTLTRVQRPTPAMFLKLVTWTLTPIINRFSGLIVEHFYVTFGDISCIGFWDIVQIGQNPNPATAIGMGNKVQST